MQTHTQTHIYIYTECLIDWHIAKRADRRCQIVEVIKWEIMIMEAGSEVTPKSHL